MAIVESGPIHIQISLEQAVAQLIREQGLEELVKKLFKDAVVLRLEQTAQDQKED